MMAISAFAARWSSRSFASHPLLDGEVHLAFGIVKFTLLAHQVGLGLLGCGKLGVERLDRLTQVRDQAVLAGEI
jgi:hypothetical protein